MTGLRSNISRNPRDHTGRIYEAQHGGTVLNGHSIKASDPRAGKYTMDELRKFPRELVFARIDEIRRQDYLSEQASGEIIDYTN